MSAATGISKVSAIDTSSDKVVDTIEVGKTPHGLALAPDGQLMLVAVFGTNQVVIVDTHTDAIIGEVSVPSPHNIAISPDGQIAYVAAQKQGAAGLVIIDINKQSQVGSIPLDKAPRALNFSPDGKWLYFTQAGVDAVQVLDPVKNQVTAQIPVGASPHHPIFTPDGQTALVVSQGPGQLSIIDPKTNTVSKVVAVGKMPHWIAVSSQGTTAWVTNEASNDVSVVDLTTGKVTATIPVGNAPRKIVVQPQATASASEQAPAAVSITRDGLHAFIHHPESRREAHLDQPGFDHPYRHQRPGVVGLRSDRSWKKLQPGADQTRPVRLSLFDPPLHAGNDHRYPITPAFVLPGYWTGCLIPS